MRVVSYNGFDFIDNGFAAYFDYAMEGLDEGSAMVGGGPVIPQFAGLNLASRVIPVEVYVSSGTIAAQLRLLKNKLDFRTPVEQALVAQQDDTGTRVQVFCRPTKFVQETAGKYTVIFEASDGRWTNVTPSVPTITGPASPGNSLALTVAVGGSTEASPQVTLAPQLAKTVSPTYSSLFTVTEQDGINCANIPYLITFNHAAQVTAGHSTSGGTDILVFVNGQQVPRTVVGPNTTTCRVVFQIPSLLSGATVNVNIQYAPSGQTYGLGGYAQDYVTNVVTENSGNLLQNYPYSITFNHAAIVTATRSQASGADIRVLVNGTEVQRAINGANTTTCQVFFPMTLAASSRVAISILTSASGYNYALSAYTNGSMDLTISTNTAWKYSTPNNDAATTPGQTRVVGMQVVGGFSVPTSMSLGTTTIGSDAAYGITIGGGAASNNYLVFWAGGVHIVSVAYECQYQTPNDIASQIEAAARLVSTTNNLMTSGWTSEVAYQNTSLTLAAYATHTLQTNAAAVAMGIERTTSNTMSGNAISRWAGSGASELQINLDSSLTPSSAGQTNPASVTGTVGFNYTFGGSLTDGTRTLTISGLSVVSGQALVIDAPSRTAWVTASGVVVAGSQVAARAAISVSSGDTNWLLCPQGATTTLTWNEASMATNGMTLSASVADTWL